jgi:hypothetical protein
MTFRVPCGPTPDEAECACGCSGYDDRCAYYIHMYEQTDRQVVTQHSCCSIPGRT